MDADGTQQWLMACSQGCCTHMDKVHPSHPYLNDTDRRTIRTEKSARTRMLTHATPLASTLCTCAPYVYHSFVRSVRKLVPCNHHHSVFASANPDGTLPRASRCFLPHVTSPQGVLKVVKLPGRRPCHDPRPVDRHTGHRIRRVERSTALCHAHRRIDAHHPLTITSEDHAVAATRFDHVERIRVPDFDRLVPRSGHDLGPVWRKGDRGDTMAVSVDLLALELECACMGRQEGSDLAEEG
eukprot:scaffold6111_cov107-Isochrysis_galbana.AAC.10